MDTCEKCPDFSCDYMKENGECGRYGVPARRSNLICGSREDQILENEING